MTRFPGPDVLDDLRSRAVPTLVVEPDPEHAPVSVVLLAGSFDPVTVAHVAIADAAAATVNADLVLFVYSVRTLPKDPAAPPPLMEEGDRLEALLRLVAARPRYALGLCSHGLLAEQVEAAATRFPGAGLTLAVGSDKLIQLLDPAWYEDPEAALTAMFARSHVHYALRAGDDEAVERALASVGERPWRDRIVPLAAPAEVAGVSSRTIRELFANGEDPRDLVPAEVLPMLPQRSSGGS
jgi:nicotinic acid mononucleotide adenylyltransferase